MSQMKPFVHLAVLIASITLSTARAEDFNQFVGLGDSTIDTGFFRYNPTGTALDAQLATRVSMGAKGGWAGNGIVGANILAGRFGLDAGSYNDGRGGTNYANGGSYTTIPSSPASSSLSTIQQIDIYLSSVNNVANRNALYEVSSGNNDLLHYPDRASLGGFSSTLAPKVAQLQAAGARIILVPNSFLGAVYAERGGDIAPSNQTSYDNSRWYNTLRWTDMMAAGVRFIPADLDSLFMHVVHNPTRFGFTADSVLSANAPVINDPSPYNTALMAILSPELHQTYLFIDGHHLTTAGQTIEADYEYSLLVAPSQVSMLAETAVQSGWAHAATIQGQLDPTGRHCRPCGRNVWTSAGVYSLDIGNTPGFTTLSGTPFGGTVGLDYQMPCGLIVGAAFTAGSQSPGFSTGGHFSQVDEAPSLYAAYGCGPMWGNAVLTYDLLQYNVARAVPLGPLFTDQNHANVSGQSLALALRGGRDFSFGRITTGPVGGWVLQQAYVNGFTETSTTGVTALSFGGQTRNSAVSQLGWRVSADFGRLRPFLEADWNHECADKNRTVTTSLTTAIVAPSYTMDATPMVTDWATTSLGAYYELSSRAMLRAAASAMYINPQMTTTGGEVGVNVSF